MEKITNIVLDFSVIRFQESYPHCPLLLNTTARSNQLLTLTLLELNCGNSYLRLGKSPFTSRIKLLDLKQVCIRGFDIVENNFYNENKVLIDQELIIIPSYNDSCSIKIVDNYHCPIDFLVSLLRKKCNEYEDAIKNAELYTNEYFEYLIKESINLKKVAISLYQLQKDIEEGNQIEIDDEVISIIFNLL